MSNFAAVCLVLGVALLLWDTVEVGRNDAANLVNAVFGARVLSRKTAVRIAGIGVVLGAVTSSRVIETARKGIFDPTMLTVEQALTVYISVYIVDTVLLYGYSHYGMPVSTTASLVFALMGASLAMQPGAVHWNTSFKVMLAIVCSILLSGFCAFLVQRAVRGAIAGRAKQLTTLLLHGGWVGGGMATALCYFLLLKGLKHVGFVVYLREHVVDVYGSGVVVVFLWAFFAVLIHAMLVIYRKRAAKALFSVLAVLGMLAMAFAFGQNDLANCASPGLAIVNLLRGSTETVVTVSIPTWQLLGCGILLVVGMTTQGAQRVTKAEVSAGSMGDRVKLWAPRWCLALASYLLRFRGPTPSLAPRAAATPAGKTMHYDALRACVILSVSACVIATASGLGMPVSTTYVAFAAVMATGMADRIFQRGDAALKLARSIWVVFSWFASAIIAATGSALVALAVYHLSVVGIAICLVTNLIVRKVLRRRSDILERRVAEEARERMDPDAYALESEG